MNVADDLIDAVRIINELFVRLAGANLPQQEFDLPLDRAVEELWAMFEHGELRLIVVEGLLHIELIDSDDAGAVPWPRRTVHWSTRGDGCCRRRDWQRVRPQLASCRANGNQFAQDSEFEKFSPLWEGKKKASRAKPNPRRTRWPWPIFGRHCWRSQSASVYRTLLPMVCLSHATRACTRGNMAGSYTDYVARTGTHAIRSMEHTARTGVRLIGPDIRMTVGTAKASSDRFCRPVPHLTSHL